MEVGSTKKKLFFPILMAEYHLYFCITQLTKLYLPFGLVYSVLVFSLLVFSTSFKYLAFLVETLTERENLGLKKNKACWFGAVKCAKITDLFKQSVSDNEASDKEAETLKKSRENRCFVMLMLCKVKVTN